MKTLKEIHAEACKYSPDKEELQDAFASGARWALTGKYYRPAELFVGDMVVSNCATPTFDDWWNCYQKKRGRKKAEIKWNKLSDKDKQDCMKATPMYVASTPDPIYRKDPLTYLNGECWNDEIIVKEDNEKRRIQCLAAKAARILGAD